MTEAGREDEKKRWMSKIDDEDGIFGGSGGSVYVADCIILVTVYVCVRYFHTFTTNLCAHLKKVGFQNDRFGKRCSFFKRYLFIN